MNMTLRTKSIVFTICAIMMLVFAFLFDSFHKKLNKPENVSERLEKIIEEREKELLKIINTHFISESEMLDINLACCKNLYPEKGFVVLEYKNDTLVNWSDNSVPVPYTITDTLTKNKLIKLPNGWFTTVVVEKQNRIYVGLNLIKKFYTYENDYLEKRFHPDYRINKNIKIQLSKEKNNVYSAEGKFLFSVTDEECKSLSDNQSLYSGIFYFLSLLFFITLLFNLYRWMERFVRSKTILIAGFALDVILIRAVQFYFKFPASLYDTKLFGPAYFASSTLLPSLGDLLVNSILLLFIVYAVFAFYRTSPRVVFWSNGLKRLASFALILFGILFYTGIFNTIETLVQNSAKLLIINSVYELSFSDIISFISISTLLFGFFLFIYRTFDFIVITTKKTVVFLVLLLTAIILFSSGYFLLFQTFEPVQTLFLLAVMIVTYFNKSHRIKIKSLYSVVIYLFLFAFITTYTLLSSGERKEKEERKLMAVKLSIERDKLAEYRFQEIEEKILADTVIAKQIPTALENAEAEEKLNQILGNYFASFRSNYNYQVTICNIDRELEVKPENYIIGCTEYFGTLVDEIGEPTASSNLFYLNDGTEDVNYLGIITLENDTNTLFPVYIYVEMYSKYIPKALGYPELLIDKQTNVYTNLTNYSYAIYSEGELIKSVGKYFYRINDSEYHKANEEFYFFKRNGYNHLVYVVDNSTQILISREIPGILEIMAPFSFLLILFGIYVLLFLIIVDFKAFFRQQRLNFRSQLQFAITSIILVSFLVIGTASVFFIVNINENKNINILNEKAHSVLIEVEHKLSDQTSLSPDISDYLQGILTKFSQVFFSDINLYDLNGKLLATSRPEIFSEGLISGYMNTIALHELSQKRKTLFIQEESIGNYSYLSAYVPFRNSNNELVAYLNLPYFARQTELRSEISAFLTAFTNINIILIALSVFIALLIANYITYPMQIIREKMSKVKLGKPNEKIQWVRKDEIGNLVMEYNRMIDELASSAELLARSERESAWREMAKQVAHEIKNPLTPMKLSIQYLQKAWDDKAPDWDDRLKRFSQNIVQQIDNLSAIATEFSDFAKMPQTKLETINLVNTIDTAAQLYAEVPDIEIVKSNIVSKEIFVEADEKQMLRVFNNLLKNSVQAIKAKKDPVNGIIEINAVVEEQVTITVKDNGIGISEEQKEKIFSPSFTTKSGGMGLGLAIVRSIVISSGGEIWFESTPGKETTFYIRLPLL